MTATLLYDGPPHTDDWYAARAGGISASEIAAVLGLSPWMSAYTLWHQKNGLLGPQQETDSMRWGTRLEGAIVAEFTERHPEFGVIGAGVYANDERPWQRATPDGVLHLREQGAGEIPVAPLEVKTDGSYDGWGEAGSDDIPIQYRAQVIWQMDTLGVRTAHVALLIGGRSYREYVVGYDEGDALVMRKAALEFLATLAGDPPPVDWLPSTSDTLKRLHPVLDDVEVDVGDDIAHEYQHAVIAAKRTGERKALAENRLRDALGDGRWAMAGGVKVATRSVYDMRETTIHRKACTVNKLIPAKAAS